jgi:predicted nucleic acid-binding protein
MPKPTSPRFVAIETATPEIVSMPDAFDADVLIHAVNETREHGACARVLAAATERVGSVVLLPEVLAKPTRVGNQEEAGLLTDLLATFELKVVDDDVADAAVMLGAKYGLKAADAIHLATAVVHGAERFFTNNTKDFGDHITEIDVVVPA